MAHVGLGASAPERCAPVRLYKKGLQVMRFEVLYANSTPKLYRSGMMERYSSGKVSQSHDAHARLPYVYPCPCGHHCGLPLVRVALHFCPGAIHEAPRLSRGVHRGPDGHEYPCALPSHHGAGRCILPSRSAYRCRDEVAPSRTEAVPSEVQNYLPDLGPPRAGAPTTKRAAQRILLSSLRCRWTFWITCSARSRSPGEPDTACLHCTHVRA